MRAHVRTVGSVTALAVVLAGSVAGAGAASAAVSPDAPVIINEVYGGGGNGGAAYTNDFVELYNPGSVPVSLSGWSVQYASATGSSWSNTTALSGLIAAGGYLLVGGASGGANGAALTPDIPGSINLSATAGKVALVSSTSQLTCATGCATQTSVVDLVGFGATASSYAGTAPAPGPANATSVSRDATHTNSGDNAADFAVGAPTPTKGGTTPTDPGTPSTKTIAEIQGTGPASPLVGQTVTTDGVVTAAYLTGGINGYVIQTPGTGGPIGDATASQGLFVYSPSTVASVAIGDHVEVTGAVSEFNGLTELSVTSSVNLTKLSDGATVTPTTGAWPTSAAARESLESMLFAPTDHWTISNTYSTNQYGEVGLATGTKPLIQPTDAARPSSPAAAAIEADNAARGVVLDDGATTNFLSAANQNLTPPYISLTNPVRVGAAATFTEPVIVDYRNDVWKLNPTEPVSTGGSPATFENDRTDKPADVGGDLKIASFNVLNYFTTLGATTAGCSSYKDRDGDGVTVNTGCDPRGAWDPADLKRQQDKIVTAINDLDADVVGLMEIENSLVVDGVADEALGTLVGALNTAAGSDVWAFVPSSADLPPASEMDVITNAIIYRKAAVERTGASHALGTLSSGTEAFNNAREPIAQAFAPVGGGEPFLVVVNHLKSKGSAGPLPGDADSGDGQGASNASRIAQANALKDWIPTIQGETKAVALVGDFNSYTQEDPLKVLYDAGYTDAASTLAEGQYSYSFSGLSGSLDHVLLNEAALERATGADIWEINAEESIALEYSRYNYHGTLFYAPDEYRSSDHDPVIVGLANSVKHLTFLNINDFHGRIDTNTVKFAGTIEQQRDQADGPTAFLSAGDNIGASLFASATLKDQPTIDVLNALGLQASAVGNHEFDQGFTDLTDRVIGKDEPNAGWDYLGANVYAKGTTTPALPEYTTFDMDGVTVAVIGAVTQETPSLVTPAGIADLDFGDPVDAVNRVAAELTDGDTTNGEADVLIAEYHDGASAGTPDGATLEQEIAAGGPFAKLVTQTSSAVDAIFTGHTHKQYAWDAAVPGKPGTTRPIVQTGNYGEFIGKVELAYDPSSDLVTAHTASNVARTTTDDAALVAAYPRVANVKTIVDAALANATTVGNQPVGSVTADITTAFSGGSYVGGKYTGGNRDDRASESALGNLVANAMRDILADDDRGGAEIGVVNPGGLRAELLYAKSGDEAEDGVVTYAEANGVLPFVNNLWTTTLTGAQVKTMLEQQWQTNPDGTVPSRPYLQLGLSDNVSYTFDPDAAQGAHITSVTVNGVPLDPAKAYRIGTFSFLATGGDNFRIFTSGADTRDSGLIDRDGWISYLEDNQHVAPDFARHAVSVKQVPSTVVAGKKLTFPVAGLDLTSLGAPQNTTLDVRLDDASIGSVPVASGAAQVDVTVPASTTAGNHVVTLVAAPSGTTVTLPVTVEVSNGPVDLTLLNINDFHGRIDANTVKFAGTVEKLRAEASGPVAFLSAGDNIGASLFASATAQDKPTIDVLNALDLQTSAVGNHEFDKGFTDLTDRVADAANWDYLGANVYDKGTTNPALDEYKVIDMDGVRVGVIGAVTQETPTLVTPGGIADLDFGDPVAAVNRVADQLTDGDESNGEADVLVAEYHEGAGAGTPDGASLEQEVAAGGAFADIVTKTSAKVDAIFTGHTHKQYAWEAPVPGEAGATRPILQTGSYGEFIGKIVLTYDPTDGDVTAHTQSNVARVTTADDALVAAYPRVAEVKSITDAAIAHANEVGSVPVGSVTADITTAFSGGAYVDGTYVGSGPLPSTGRDDRANESTLGNLVADALRDTLAPQNLGGAQIGVVNPGGLRDELFYDPDGVITTAEANGVLPFVNNLWTTTLTGAQVKTMLEQQWQTNPDGTVPSRPYLALGLSDNVSYTYDESAAQGHHVTSVTVDGHPLDPAADYRIGTFSFLAQGGDNFRVFTSGTATKDSGLIDRDGWIAYLQDHEDLAPDFARHAVGVPALPATVTAGNVLTFPVTELDLTSLGSPLNTALAVKLDGTSIGTATVSGGNASVEVTIPVSTTAGNHVLTLVAAPSGTTVTLPVTVKTPVPSAVTTTTKLTVTGGKHVGQTLTLTATVAPATAAGSVTFRDGTKTLKKVTVKNGKASTTAALTVGKHTLTAVFTPTDAGKFTASTSPAVSVTIAKSASATSLGLKPTSAAFGSAVTATVTVAGSTSPPKGKVEIRDGKTVLRTAVLSTKGTKGTVKVTLPKSLTVGKHSLSAVYVGSSTVSTSKGAATLKITQAKPTVKVTASKWSVKKNARVTLTVTVSGKQGAPKPSGKVTVKVGGTTVMTKALSGGKVKITLPKAKKTATVTVTYAGSKSYASAKASHKLTVR